MTNKNELLKRALFIPCESKEALHRWVKVYLGINLPDVIVAEESNSSPMDLIWEIYSKARANNDEKFSRVMAYASRGSFKTLGASILEVLTVLHLRRDVCHMAATRDQSDKSIEYVRNFLSMPFIRDFIDNNNKKRMELVRYENAVTKESITKEEFSLLLSTEQQKYNRYSNFIQIVICSLVGANGSHSELFCVDGKTDLLVKKHGDILRSRKRMCARGIYNVLAGRYPSGRTGGEFEEIIETPKKLVEVLSFNFNTGEYEFKPIAGAIRKFSEVLELETVNGTVICTPEHPIYTVKRGFIQASELSVGESVVWMGKAPSASLKTKMFESDVSPIVQDPNFYDEWEQVILGSLLGDCGIYKKPTNNPYIREQHCLEQTDYLNYKREIISRKLLTKSVKCVSGHTQKELVGYASGNSPLLLPYINIRNNLEGLELLGPQGLAVWYMDDGCSGNGFRLSTEGFTFEQNETISKFLKKKFDIDTTTSSYSRDGKIYYYIRGPVESKHKLVQICEKFIHPTMAYKFDLSANTKKCKYCEKQIWNYKSGNNVVHCGSAVCGRLQSQSLQSIPIVAIRSLSKKWVFDFLVQDNNNFISNGFLSKNCVDEIDTIDGDRIRGYRESKNIPKARNGNMPITLLTSTRKFSYGLVQKELDQAHKTGLHVRHWNVIDILESCPPERHRPNEPKVELWINDTTLEVVKPEALDTLDEKTKSDFRQQIGFAGCTTCSLFAACKTRLVTHQTSKSAMLAPIGEIAAKFKDQSLDDIQTQLLCRKPSSSGLIYPNFNREVHMKTATDIFEMIIGDKQTVKKTKQDLLDYVVGTEARFYSGIDFGFTHPFAVTTGFVWGNYCFVIDVISQSGLELDDKISACNKLKILNPTVFADPEDPASAETFRKKGKFHVKKWNKEKGSVKRGIESVRAKLKPAVGKPTLFFLKDDPGCELLATKIESYHFETDLAGEVSETPSTVANDEMDSLRYLIMNVFSNKGKLIAALEENDIITSTPGQSNITPKTNINPIQQQMQTIISNYLEDPFEVVTTNSEDDNEAKKKSNNFFWDIT